MRGSHLNSVPPCFFGATGQGFKGEYKETFFYGGGRFVMDARWVWMRQKQLVFRSAAPRDILSEIGLLPGRRGLLWGADEYALGFARAALERRADLAVIASKSAERDGIAALAAMGIAEERIIDRDQFALERQCAATADDDWQRGGASVHRVAVHQAPPGIQTRESIRARRHPTLGHAVRVRDGARPRRRVVPVH